MSQQIVYKNWPRPAPSWTEVLLDLVHHYLRVVLLHLAAIMGTPLRDLDSLWEKVVKVVVPFTIIWGLSCWGDDENRRVTIRVLSWLTSSVANETLQPVLVVVGALVSAATIPPRYVRRLNSRVATRATAHTVRAFWPNAEKWGISLLGLVFCCVRMAVCAVAIASFMAVVVYVPNPYQIHVGFRRWRTRVADDVWWWLFPLPPVERSVIPLIRRKRNFEEELRMAEVDLYLVFPRHHVFPRPLPASRSPLPTSASPTPNHSPSFTHPAPPPPSVARPAGGRTTHAPVPQRYKDRPKSKYFRGPRWSPIPLV
ncbi:hypothetical protein TWF173_007195 [Orbilia oligospora]|nr:hypothetical protein TWF173_007195 [Orbilia oligospora]